MHTDDAVIKPARMLVDALLPQLRALSVSVARFDEEIARLVAKRPDYDLFANLPGAGPTLAPRLLAAFGERRDRFENASAVQKCMGIAPILERSGNKSWIHWRYGCSRFQRQTFVEWAGQTSPGRFGPRPSTTPIAPAAVVIRQPCARWPSSGSASSTAAGSTASPTTSHAN